MADASDTMRFLVKKFATAPAGTREEAQMAKELSETIHLHGLQTINQDFNYPFLGKVPLAGAIIVMALAALLAGFGVTVLSVICLVLALASCALYVLELRGIHLLKGVGKPGCSQNLIARHPAASVAPGQKSRPIVVVAHYDTPRADIMAMPLLRGLQPYMELATFVAMVVELVTIVVHLLPLPTVVHSVAWALAIVAAVVLLFQGVRLILNRFVMPFTAGANDNMSGVAALLGLLYRVRPSIDSSMIGAGMDADAEESAVGDVAYVDGGFVEEPSASEGSGRRAQAVVASREERARLERRERRLASQPVRRGVDVLRSLGMVPESCEIEYEGAPASADLGETMLSMPVGGDAGAPMGAAVRAGAPSSEGADSEHAPFEAPSVSAVHERIPSPEPVASVQEELPLEGVSAPAAQPELPEQPAAPAQPAGATMVLTHDQLDAVRAREAQAAAVQPQAVPAPVEAMPVSPQSEGNVVAVESSEPVSMGELPDVPEAPRPFDVITSHDEPDVELGKTGIMLPKDVAQQQGNLLDDDEVRRDSILNSPTWGTTSFTPVSVNQNRRILEDVPDPSVAAVDPFSVANVETIGDYNPDDFSAMDFESGTHEVVTPAMLEDYRRRTTSGFDFEGTSSNVTGKRSRGKRGRAGSTGRISRRAAEMAAQMQEESFSDWLGVDEDFDAQKNGREMGSWANFADDAPNGSAAQAQPGQGQQAQGDLPFDDGALPDDDGFYPDAPNGSQGGPSRGSRRWQGGAASASARRRAAAGSQDAPEQADAERRELRQAAMQLGDRDLISHEIWFVLTGASEADNAGAQAFFDEYAKKLRGAYVINVEAVGAGRQSLVIEEGLAGHRKANRRLVNLFGEASQDIGRPLALARMPWRDTEATSAMRQGFHGVTLSGVDKGCPANARWTGDVPESVNPAMIDDAVDIMVEVIKRA